MKKQFIVKSLLFGLAGLLDSIQVFAEGMNPYTFSFNSKQTGLWLMLILGIILLTAALILKMRVGQLSRSMKKKKHHPEERINELFQNIKKEDLDQIIESRSKSKKNGSRGLLLTVLTLIISSLSAGAQTAPASEKAGLLNEGGIIITIILILIPLLAGFVLLIYKIGNAIRQYRNQALLDEADTLAHYIKNLPEATVEQQIKKRKIALEYQLPEHELSGNTRPADSRGLLHINASTGLNFVAAKQKALPRPSIDPALTKLVIWYLGCATFWLLFGTTIGEYLGIKFIAPDADHLSWLSFGRLRPVHTNSVFWGWASLGMLGLGYYIVPRVSNTPLYSLKMGWYSLTLINLTVIIGSISLMAGINNGGGEYREYIWPIMLLFGIGLALTLINFLKTIAARKTKEIYISNWYMVAAIIFTIVISLVAYIPFWQNGLGETIVQGYYMHQGVGMWFMLFTLGIVYYFLPQQLNKPIYSYSLGILAFWTQILFYTLIGTHHFVFSAIPWWLQTVAIVGSAGMAIPVVAGTTNFLMTFKGAWHKLRDSYTLPFFLVGILFYFTGSMQGTAEAFRFTNLIWHFTDFTVAHSHLTMYGIICFFLWACIYAVLPRLTGKEAPQITIGAHFWLALIGLMFYSIPLMYGGTMRGLMWLEGRAFIESVTMMMPYWLWRAIGGSLMWASHLFFAYNMYKMIAKKPIVDINQATVRKLKSEILHPQEIVTNQTN